MAKKRPRSKATTGVVTPTNPNPTQTLAPDDLLDIHIPGEDEYTIPSDNFLDYTGLIYGEKSYGKTSLTSRFEKNLTIQLDPDRQTITNRQIAVRVLGIEELHRVDMATQDPWLVIKSIMRKAAADDTVQCLTIDNVARYFDAATHSLCATENIDDPQELTESWGAGWRKVRGMYQSYVNAWRDTGKGLLLTAHGKQITIKPRDGSEAYDMYSPAMSAALLGYIKEICDYCFAIDLDDQGKRILHIRPSTYVWAACGSDEHFISPSGMPLQTIPLGDNTEEAYQALTRAFKNEVFDISESSKLKFKGAATGTKAKGGAKKPAARKRRSR